MFFRTKSNRFRNVWRWPLLFGANRGKNRQKLSALVLVVGREQESLARNAIESFVRHHPGVALSVYGAQNSEEFLKFVDEIEQAELMSVDEAVGSRSDGLEPGLFGTTEFNLLVENKWKLIARELLIHRGTVLFFDSDVYFRRSVEAVVLKISSKFPIGIQDEVGEKVFPIGCTGFMFFNRRALPFLNLMVKFSRANRGQANDQIFFNALVRKEPNAMRGIFFLPPALFPTGRLWRLFLPESSQWVLGELEPYIFHANFVPNVSGKEALLRETRNWGADSLADTSNCGEEIA